MALQDLVHKINPKETLKIAGATAVGLGFAYVAHTTGITPWLFEFTRDSRESIFGNWNASTYEYFYTHGGKYLGGAGIAMIAGIPAYLGLDKLLK